MYQVVQAVFCIIIVQCSNVVNKCFSDEDNEEFFKEIAKSFSRGVAISPKIGGGGAPKIGGAPINNLGGDDDFFNPMKRGSAPKIDWHNPKLGDTGINPWFKQEMSRLVHLQPVVPPLLLLEFLLLTDVSAKVYILYFFL